MLTLNVPHRGLSSLEEAWIVHSLCRTHGMQQIKVAELIGHDVSWVCRRMKLAESLVPELQEDVQLGLLSPTCAREVARLPRGKQAETGQAIREHGLTSRQATQLAQVLLRTDDPCAQREVLHDPLRYVTAPPSATKSAGDPSLSVEANKIRLCLLAWEETSGRLVRSLQRYAPRGVGNDDARALAPLCGTALRAGHGAADCLAQALDDSNLRSDRDG